MSDATSDAHDQGLFNAAISALHAEIANVGAHLAIDGNVRALYDRQVQAMATELRLQAQQGQITWAQD
ncbi:hypothetical protein [Roseospira navarrensis]|uniref:Uncharacterized protein n=1 Tax=Roseospira navarrensis TaxID=140058 RepID=A0A7X1ZHH0_9PROT|nr:hypothetical protein [Roseospira navarrensis]MQX38594.1 hypothetical protein [Roseospira navarrensis]